METLRKAEQTTISEQVIRICSSPTEIGENESVVISREELLGRFVFGSELRPNDVVLVNNRDVSRHQQRPGVGNNRLFLLAELDLRSDETNFIIDGIATARPPVAAD